MKKLSLISMLMILGFTSCGVYRPSVTELKEQGFTARKISNIPGIDFYQKKLNDAVFMEILYHPRLNVWIMYAGHDGDLLSSFQFDIRNKQNFKVLMGQFH